MGKKKTSPLFCPKHRRSCFVCQKTAPVRMVLKLDVMLHAPNAKGGNGENIYRTVTRSICAPCCKKNFYPQTALVAVRWEKLETATERRKREARERVLERQRKKEAERDEREEWT